MSPNDTKWLANDYESAQCEPDPHTSQFLRSLGDAFPRSTAVFSRSKYLERLTLSFAEGVLPDYYSLWLYDELVGSKWVIECTYWNYHRNRVEVTGVTLMRDL